MSRRESIGSTLAGSEAGAARLTPDEREELERLKRLNNGMSRLVRAVQELSLAKDMAAIMGVVKRAARELTGAEGATFVLRENDQCFCADEDAIGPLWKGQRFPIETCISGWVMLNRTPALIQDIYNDSRIHADAYLPTFVKSLAMVPIRPELPLGAIGIYWATPHDPLPDEVSILQALADTTAVAIQNVQVYEELEKRVSARTAELELANQELEAFSHAVSHDLQAPLRILNRYANVLLLEKAKHLDAESQVFLKKISGSAVRMGALIKDLLRLSRINHCEVGREVVSISALGQEVYLGLKSEYKSARCQIEENMVALGDAGLIRIVLENLLSNAFKYSSLRLDAMVEVGCSTLDESRQTFYVRDNGVGFNLSEAPRLFTPFQRYHREAVFQGLGLGLATVKRVVEKHQGRIWVESCPNEGTTFYFRLVPVGTNLVRS